MQKRKFLLPLMMVFIMVAFSPMLAACQAVNFDAIKEKFQPKNEIQKSSESVTDEIIDNFIKDKEKEYQEEQKRKSGAGADAPNEPDEIKYLSLPIMAIDLENDFPLAQVNRDDYVGSKISILNTDKRFELNNVTAEFRGRGNSSWTWYEKKGYRIKFDKKQSLFGATANKHWVLVAQAHDASMTANGLAQTIAKNVLNGIEYTTSVNYIEVYINGFYNGVYYLFEQVRVGDGRVNISSEIGILNTGYLIEYDANFFYDNDVREGIDYFRIQGLPYPFSMKSPDPDDVTDENEVIFQAQVRYIQSYVQTCIDAMSFDYEMFLNLCDINSFVDMYVLHELLNNRDRASSFFMYKKPNGKLYCGPVWDFDSSCGLDVYISSDTLVYEISSPYGIYPTYRTGKNVFDVLSDNLLFQNSVKTRWHEISNNVKQIILNYYNQIQKYNDCFLHDIERWQRPVFQEQVRIKDWLIKRAFWFDGYFV
jgi:hypothetical protein